MEEKKSYFPGYVYILQSCLNSRYYIGSTKDIENRIIEHQKGEIKSTENILPLELKFFKKYKDIKIARQIEFKLKKMKSRKIIEKIIIDQDLKITV